MRKKVLACLLAAAMTVGTFSTVMAEEELKMGFIVGSFEHVFYNLIAEGIEEEAAAKGVKATILDADLDASVASDKIQNLSADGNVAIALACNDAAGCKPAIENADAEGVKMFTFDCTSESDAINCFVGTDNFEGGKLGGQELIRLTEDGDTVAIIGYPTASSCLDRENGALEVLEGADRNVLTGYNYEGDANKAAEIMENILTSNPDVAAVFCVGDPAASGALSAIRANASDCVIIGFDGNPEAKEAILNEETGKWWVSEISQDPHQIGTRIVDEMVSFMTDGTVTDKVVYIAPYIITAETLAAEAEGGEEAAEEAPAEEEAAEEEAPAEEEAAEEAPAEEEAAEEAPAEEEAAEEEAAE